MWADEYDVACQLCLDFSLFIIAITRQKQGGAAGCHAAGRTEETVQGVILQCLVLLCRETAGGKLHSDTLCDTCGCNTDQKSRFVG